MPKIVFFDIDGTLLDHEKQLPESTAKAVKALQDKGVITAISTGRAPFMHKDIREKLGIRSYISYNGQYVVYENEELYKNPIPLTELETLQGLTTEHGHPIAYMGSQAMGASHDPSHPFITKSFASLKFPVPAYDPHFYKNQEIYQALLFYEKEEKPTYLDTHAAFDTIPWHEHSMDVLPKGGSKAAGIQKILDRLEIPVSEAVAFGDGLNDIEMLQHVGTGIAMGNAVNEAKQAATMVTEAVDQDGILKGLQKIGLL